MDNNSFPKILRLKGVMDITKMSRSAIYLGMAEDAFPTQIKLGKRSVGWLEHEIYDWVQARIAESRSAA